MIELRDAVPEGDPGEYNKNKLVLERLLTWAHAELEDIAADDSAAHIAQALDALRKLR